MKKQKVQFIALMVVIIVIMAVVYVKVNMERMNTGTCVNGTSAEVIEEKGQSYLLIDKAYQTSSKKCVSIDIKVGLNIFHESIIFKDGEEDEYSSKFQATFKQDKKQNTVSKEDIKLVTKYAVLDNNIFRVSMEVEVKEKGQVNTYEIKDEILLSIKDGKITEGR